MGKNLILIFYQDFFHPKSMKYVRSIIILFTLLFSAVRSDGQFFEFSGSRSQSLANASAGLVGCWSAFGNQAGLADLTNIEIAVAFQNRFLVPELSDRIGLIAFPVQSNVIAFSFYQFGEVPFRQEKFGLSYARHISPKIRFGLQFNYYRVYLPEANRSAGSAGLEIGLQYLASSKFNLGLHVVNPYQISVKTYSGKYNYPSHINLGYQYYLSDVCLWLLEIENDFDRYFRIKTGLEYCILEKLFLRIGVATNPYLLSSGIGFRLRRLNVDLGNSFHANLGNSPSISLSYPLGR